jgi:prevent-host-death family protein
MLVELFDIFFTYKYNDLERKEKVGTKGMKISTDAIVSNSDMIKSYRSCREKAEYCGKIFVLKNNQPDAVLISAAEYEKLSTFIEYMDTLEESERAAFIGQQQISFTKKA